MANGEMLQAQDARAGAEAEKVQEAPEPVDEGVPRMTPKVILESCLSNRGYSAPELNEVLILHYKGFRKIEGLDAYSQVRSLFLECNGIRRIENLEAMPLLVSLYLQSNCITAVENLEALPNLQHLNLSNNGITHISGLASLQSLETINLAANKIASVEALQGLAERPSLKSVDVSCNYIEEQEGDAFVNFWAQNLPQVECLYLHHNTCSRSLKDYRRRLVSGLPKLRWIDERPVTAAERVGSEAWATGGKEAEAEAKRVFCQKEQDDKRRSFDNFRRIQQAAAERAKAQREAQASREAARSRAAEELRDTGEVADGWVAVPGRQATGPQRDAAEPSRQRELHSKVEAFFRSPDGEPAAEAEVNVETATNRELEQEEATGEAPQADIEADEAASLADDGPEEVGPEGPPAGEEGRPEEEAPVQEGPFEWSGFRDKRLGRLVADFRYNFRKAAESLGQEFGCSVTEQECRSRYGALTRPSSAASTGSMQPRPTPADRGRAKDAPEPDAAAVKEVSDWWLRRLAKAPRDGPSQLSKLLGAGAGGDAQCALAERGTGAAQGEAPDPGMVAAVPISPFASLVEEDASSASAARSFREEETEEVVDLSSMTSAARARAAASAEPARERKLAFAPPPRPAAAGGASHSAGLFELD